MTEYEKYIQRKQEQYGDRFIPPTSAARLFARFLHSDVRIKVRRTYPNGEVHERTGTVGITTGWAPAFLLMHRSNHLGSSDVLNEHDEIVAVRWNGRTYEPVRGPAYAAVPLVALEPAPESIPQAISQEIPASEKLTPGSPSPFGGAIDIDAAKAAQRERDAREAERRAALSDADLASESGWDPVPAGEPLYKILTVTQQSRDAHAAGQAPYQRTFLWYYGKNYRVEGTLEPCANALHAIAREQLPRWYEATRVYDYLHGAVPVVYTLVPLEPAYSAQGKTFTRAARLGRRLPHAELLAILEQARAENDKEGDE